MLAPILLAMLAQAAAPLPATGKWVIEGDNNMCALLRTFGEGRSAVTLGIRPWPLGEKTDILMWTFSGREGVDHGTEHLRIDAGPSLDSDYVGIPLNHGQRLETAAFPDTMLTSLAAAKALHMIPDRRQPIELALPEMKPALAALEGCKQLLFKNLGIDPDWNVKMATQPAPIGDDKLWFSSSDYPDNPLDGGMQGISHLLLTIGTNGRVTHCVTFGSTGNREMDETACKLFELRGRYYPAKDRQGQPMVSYIQDGVSWVIPS